MPLEKYMPDDPFENHPLFKTEEQARIEDTMDGVQSIVDEPTSLDWPSADTVPRARRARPTEPPSSREAEPSRGVRAEASDERPLVALARLRLGRLSARRRPAAPQPVDRSQPPDTLAPWPS